MVLKYSLPAKKEGELINPLQQERFWAARFRISTMPDLSVRSSNVFHCHSHSLASLPFPPTTRGLLWTWWWNRGSIWCWSLPQVSMPKHLLLLWFLKDCMEEMLVLLIGRNYLSSCYYFACFSFLFAEKQEASWFCRKVQLCIWSPSAVRYINGHAMPSGIPPQCICSKVMSFPSFLGYIFWRKISLCL